MLRSAMGFRFARVARAAGLAISLAALGCAHARQPHPALPSSHRHDGVHLWTVEDAIPEFSMAETAVTATPAGMRPATSADGRFVAFVVGTESGPAHFRLVVGDRNTGRTLEIRGLPFEWRPYSDLAWADIDTLVFDRWSSPRYGMHYAVDVARGRLIASVPFHTP